MILSHKFDHVNREQNRSLFTHTVFLNGILILNQYNVIRCGKCVHYLPGVAGGAGAGVSAAGLAGA